MKLIFVPKCDRKKEYDIFEKIHCSQKFYDLFDLILRCKQLKKRYIELTRIKVKTLMFLMLIHVRNEKMDTFNVFRNCILVFYVRNGRMRMYI